jgi:hypothetical protein
MPHSNTRTDHHNLEVRNHLSLNYPILYAFSTIKHPPPLNRGVLDAPDTYLEESPGPPRIEECTTRSKCGHLSPQPTGPQTPYTQPVMATPRS